MLWVLSAALVTTNRKTTVAQPFRFTTPLSHSLRAKGEDGETRRHKGLF
jgi:hypothetical protein